MATASTSARLQRGHSPRFRVVRSCPQAVAIFWSPAGRLRATRRQTRPIECRLLSALAANALLQRAIADSGLDPALSQVVLGDREVGMALVDNPRVALLSATGSTRMGREVGPRVAQRFGRSLLELGGNNAAIVTPSADLDLRVRGDTAHGLLRRGGDREGHP